MTVRGKQAPVMLNGSASGRMADERGAGADLRASQACRKPHFVGTALICVALVLGGCSGKGPVAGSSKPTNDRDTVTAQLDAVRRYWAAAIKHDCSMLWELTTPRGRLELMDSAQQLERSKSENLVEEGQIRKSQEYTPPPLPAKAPQAPPKIVCSNTFVRNFARVTELRDLRPIPGEPGHFAGSITYMEADGEAVDDLVMEVTRPEGHWAVSVLSAQTR